MSERQRDLRALLKEKREGKGPKREKPEEESEKKKKRGGEGSVCEKKSAKMGMDF